MKTLPTLSIGIPAFNEEKTLPQLLKALSKQLSPTFTVTEIAVLSDASTDSTDTLTKNWGVPVSLRRSKVRQGKYPNLYAFFQTQNTDCVVILDADVQIKSQDFLTHLTKGIFDKTADLTAAKVRDLAPQTWVENALSASMALKYEVFESFNQGNNIFTCHGRARAFSRQLYRSMPLQDASVAEDAFSYLWTVRNGLSYRYAPQAEVWYRLPKTLADHHKQSARFTSGFAELQMHPENASILKSEQLSKLNLLMAAIRVAVTRPLGFIQYLIVFGLSKVQRAQSNDLIATWTVAESSKQL